MIFLFLPIIHLFFHQILVENMTTQRTIYFWKLLDLHKNIYM